MVTFGKLHTQRTIKRKKTGVESTSAYIFKMKAFLKRNPEAKSKIKKNKIAIMSV